MSNIDPMNRFLPIQDHRFGRLLYVYDFDFPAEESHVMPSNKRSEDIKNFSEQLPDSQNDLPSSAKISKLPLAYPSARAQELG